MTNDQIVIACLLIALLILAYIMRGLQEAIFEAKRGTRDANRVIDAIQEDNELTQLQINDLNSGVLINSSSNAMLLERMAKTNELLLERITKLEERDAAQGSSIKMLWEELSQK